MSSKNEFKKRLEDIIKRWLSPDDCTTPKNSEIKNLLQNITLSQCEVVVNTINKALFKVSIFEHAK